MILLEPTRRQAFFCHFGDHNDDDYDQKSTLLVSLFHDHDDDFDDHNDNAGYFWYSFHENPHDYHQNPHNHPENPNNYHDHHHDYYDNPHNYLDNPHDYHENPQNRDVSK